MSRIRTNVITNRMANGAPTVSNGLVISGLTTTSDVNVGTGATLNVYGGATYSGVVTATSFSGSGANLTSLPSQVTINNASGNRVITSDGGTTLNGEDTLRYDGTNFLIGTNTEAPYSNRNLTVAAGGSGSTTVAIEIRSPSNGTGRVIFSDGTSADSSANEGQVIYQQSDHKMLFGVAANYQNMALESTGGTGADLNLIDGNLKFASGHGIDFSATSDASGMTSELFDDYERGTHTFTVTGSTSNPTVNISSGHNKLYYTKIGDMVHVTGELRWSFTSHGSGTLRISIPFTSSSTASSGCQGTAQTWNVNWAWRAETKDLMSEVQPNANYMVFRMGGSNSLNEDLLTLGSTYQQSANSGYGVEYQVSLWYRTG